MTLLQSTKVPVNMCGDDYVERVGLCTVSWLCRRQSCAQTCARAMHNCIIPSVVTK